MDKKNFIINIPKNMKIIIWKKSYNNYVKIILNSDKKKFIVLYNNNDVIIDKWSNSIFFLNNIQRYTNLKIENKINFFFKSLNSYFYSKIKFKGKGFRIKFFKKIKLIKFFFGKSHKTFLYLKKVNKKKINKYKFIIYNLNYKKLNLISKLICKIKKLNFYTLRGLRISRQIIHKRKGKKGTYI